MPPRRRRSAKRRANQITNGTARTETATTPDWRPHSNMRRAYRRDARGRGGLAGDAARFRALGDRHPHQVAPLGPRAVIVADLWEAEQVGEDEPGVAGPLSDAAVGDHVIGQIEAELVLIYGREFGGALEGAVVVGRLLPGLAHRTRDVTAADRTLLRVIRHVQQLAG